MSVGTLEDLKVGRVTHMVPMDEIISDLPGFNCRGKINPSSCVELANEIKEKGLLFPPVVRPYVDAQHFPGKKYALVAGFRRHMAHVILRRTHIEVEIRNDLNDRQARVLNLTENLEREDLTLMQEARAFQNLKDVIGLSSKQIGKELNRSTSWVDIRLMALDLEPEIQDKIEFGFLTQENIKQIHALEPGEERYEACKQLTTAKLRGDSRKVKIGKSKPKNPHTKKNRSSTDVYELQDHMLNEFGNGSLENCPLEIKRLIQVLGWTTGDASDMDVYTTLRRIAEEQGFDYSIPEEAFDFLKG